MKAYIILYQAISLVFVYSGYVFGIPLEDFYPFGSMHGDTKAPINDDGSTPAIPISSLFPFFNNQHSSLIVNTNGVISFLGTMSTFTPSPFPLGSNRRLIAPYWADVDTRNGGELWYRETTNNTLLEKASEEIRYFFPQQFRFHASWMFIATWSDVAFYGADQNGTEKRCMFQCLLATNGRHSFTFFMYNKTEWTTGTASGGSSSTGLGGTPAQVGFDAGDGVNYFALNASRTPAIIGVTGMSNIGVPGKFLFRVDSAEIEEGGCNTDGTLTITPPEASMFGGTLLVVSGPCFNHNESATLTISGVSVIPCKVSSEISVSCITPPVYTTGKKTVVLKITRNDGEVLEFTGAILIVNHVWAKQVVTRYPEVWEHGSNVQVQWSADQINLITWTIIRVDLYYPAVQDDGNIVLEHHSTTSPVTPTSYENGVYMYSFQLNFVKEAGIVRISTEDPDNPYYWSDMFTVKGFVQSEEVCERWINNDLANPTIEASLTSSCPCNVDAMQIDLSRFHLDPLCLETGANQYYCPHQAFARACFNQNEQSSEGFDSQCCYDRRGLLMNPDGLLGSGYINRYHYLGGSNNIPFLSNFVFDIVPYQHCCIYPSQQQMYRNCAVFYTRRPPNSCMNYRPPVVVRTSGDPHFVTLDGVFYTFNAIGEFKAISNGNFTVQFRLEQFGNSQGSSVTAIAAQPYNNADIIQIQPNTIRGIDVLVNGQQADFENSISKMLSVAGATVQLISGDQPSVTVSFEKPQISFKASAELNILNILIMMSTEVQAEDFVGLYGNKDGNKENDFKSQNGEIINSNSSMADIHNIFGLSWRVTENESLFYYPSGKTYQSYQNMNFNPVIVIPEVIPTSITEVCGSNAECIYDFYVTGDESLGKLSANVSDQFDIIVALTVTVSSCGFPYNVTNGTWLADGYTEGSTAELKCGNGYIPTVNTISCSHGNWSVNNATCFQYETADTTTHSISTAESTTVEHTTIDELSDSTTHGGSIAESTAMEHITIDELTDSTTHSVSTAKSTTMEHTTTDEMTDSTTHGVSTAESTTMEHTTTDEMTDSTTHGMSTAESTTVEHTTTDEMTDSTTHGMSTTQSPTVEHTTTDEMTDSTTHSISTTESTTVQYTTIGELTDSTTYSVSTGESTTMEHTTTDEMTDSSTHSMATATSTTVDHTTTDDMTDSTTHSKATATSTTVDHTTTDEMTDSTTHSMSTAELTTQEQTKLTIESTTHEKLTKVTTHRQTKEETETLRIIITTESGVTESSSASMTKSPTSKSKIESTDKETFIIIVSILSSSLVIFAIISVISLILGRCQRKTERADQKHKETPRYDNNHPQWWEYFVKDEHPLYRGRSMFFQQKHFHDFEN